MGVQRLWLILQVHILRAELEFGLCWMQPAADHASLPGCGICKADALGTQSRGIPLSIPFSIPPSLPAWGAALLTCLPQPLVLEDGGDDQATAQDVTRDGDDEREGEQGERPGGVGRRVPLPAGREVPLLRAPLHAGSGLCRAAARSGLPFPQEEEREGNIPLSPPLKFAALRSCLLPPLPPAPAAILYPRAPCAPPGSVFGVLRGAGREGPCLHPSCWGPRAIPG